MSSCVGALMSICTLYHINTCTFNIGNNPISCVNSFEHLVHVIKNQLTDDADIPKRSDFVGNSNNVLCFFSKLSSLIK